MLNLLGFSQICSERYALLQTTHPQFIFDEIKLKYGDDIYDRLLRNNEWVS